MTWSGLSDPNTDLRFHCSLLIIAALNFFFGFPLLSIPLTAWVAARWIILLLSFIKRRAAQDALGEWNGRYYAFDDRQIRIHWDSEHIWLEASTIFHAANRKPDPKTLERIRRRIGDEHYCVPPAIGKPCLSAQGALDYLAGLDEETAQSLRRWLEREVLPNLKRLRERQADHYKQHSIDT